MSFIPPNTNLTITLDTLDLNYVKTSGATFTGPLVLNGANLVLATGTETIGGRNLTADGAIIDALNTSSGILTRTGSGTFRSSQVRGTSGQVTVENGNGVSDDPTISLSAVGTAGTYTQVTTDATGRVIVGSNPSTLAGMGITDAVAKSDATAANTAGSVVARDMSGNFSAGTITAELSGNAATATKLATARNINGVAFDGSQNITLTADDIGSGSTNRYFSDTLARGAISVSGALTYNSSTGVLGIDETVTSVAGKVGNITLEKADVGLDQIVNLLQVVNAGGVGSIQSGLLSARPNPQTSGRLYIATDTSVVYRDNGASWVRLGGEITGDVLIEAGSGSSSLAEITTAGSFTKVSINTKGQVVSGSNPSTLVDAGIMDGASTTGATFTGNVVLNGANIQMTGSETVDGRDLSQDGETIDDILAGEGLVSRTISGGVTHKTIQGVADQVSVVNSGSDINLGIANNPIVPGSGSITVPRGTTVQRSTGSNGMVRFNTTTNALETAIGSIWKSIVLDDDLRLSQHHVFRVSKEPAATEYATIEAAITACSALAASGEQCLIEVGPGEYEENALTVPGNVHISGFTEYAVTIKPTSSIGALFTMEGGSTMAFLTITDVLGLNQPVFKVHNTNHDRGVLMHKVAIYNSVLGWDVDATTADTIMYLEYCDITSAGDENSYGIKARSSNGFSSYLNCENFYVYAGDNGNAEQGIDMSGPDTLMNMQSFGMEGDGDGFGTGINLRDGARLDSKAGSVFGWNTGAHIENFGDGAVMNFIGVSFRENTTYDLKADHPDAKGSLTGTASRLKVDTDNAPNFTLVYADVLDNEFVQTGDFYMGQTSSTLTNVTDLLLKTPPMGLLSGGAMTAPGGLFVTVASGAGYVLKDGEVARVEWATDTIAVSANTSPYIYVSKNGAILTASTEPDGTTNVVLGRAGVNGTAVYSLGPLSVDISNYGNRVENYLRQAVGTVYVSGSIVTENATTPRAIDVTAGRWMYGTQVRNPSAKTAPSIIDVYKDSGNTVFSVTTQIPNGTIDNGTALVAMTSGYFTKHTLYQSSEGAYQQYTIAHGQAEYATLDEALAAPLPTPRIPPDSTPHIAAIIVQQGNNNIAAIQDIRPLIFRSTSSGASGTSEHGDLTGLGDDDHQQYLLVNGNRALAGDLNLNTNDLINVGLINGLDITALSDRFLPNGADPITTASAVGLNTSSVNSTGLANSFARSDHTHSLSGVQASSTELTALAAISGTGIVRRTGANTWTTGTAVNLSTEVTGNLDISHINSGANASSSTFLRGDGTWAVTDGLKSLAFTQPSSGFTITGGGTTANPTATFALTNDLGALEALNGTGFAVRTGTDTWAQRTITGTTDQLVVVNGNGVSSNPVLSLANNVVLPGTESMTLPVGTTGQRPSSPTEGMIRFNSTLGRDEVYSGGAWRTYARIDGDTFTGKATMAGGIDMQSTLDFTPQTTVPAAVPPSGTRRMYSFNAGATTVLEVVDSTGYRTRLFRDTGAIVKNTTGVDIQKGKAVYITGQDSGLLTIGLSRSDNPATMPVFGITNELITNNGTGRVLLVGNSSGINTSGFTAGATLYASSTVAGDMTSTPPVHPAMAQPLGTVVSSNASTGEIHVNIGTNIGANNSTNKSTFVIGTSNASSMVLAHSSTAQRTFTFPNVSGTVITSNNLPTTTISGDISGSGTTAITLTLPTTGVSAGTYNNLTVNTKGLVTGGSNISYLTANQTINLSGDITGSGTTALTTTLANSGVTAGTYNGITVDAKGRVTAGANYTFAGTANQVAVNTASNTITTSLVSDPVIPGTGGMVMPTGTTAQRSGTPTVGTTRYNSSTGKFEGWNGSAWVFMSFPASGAHYQMWGGNIAGVSGTTSIPSDTTAPLNTEGTQIFTINVTPTSAASSFIIDMAGLLDSGTGTRMVTVAVFRGTTCIHTSGNYFATAAQPRSFSLNYVDNPGTSSAVTYSVRVGTSTAGSNWFFGRGSTLTYGNTTSVGWKITEVL